MFPFVTAIQNKGTDCTHAIKILFDAVETGRNLTEKDTKVLDLHQDWISLMENASEHLCEYSITNLAICQSDQSATKRYVSEAIPLIKKSNPQEVSV